MKTVEQSKSGPV